MNRPANVVKLVFLTMLLSACATKIPIMAVQLADDDGRNRVSITPAEIQQWVDQANETWGKRGYKFTFDPDKDLIVTHSTVLNTQPTDDNDDQWEFYRIAGNYLASLLPDNAIPVFFRAKGNSGWSWGPGNMNFISMPAYINACTDKAAPDGSAGSHCTPDKILLSHELGHYFGLAHTFTDADCGRIAKDNTDGDLHGQLLNTTADDIHDTAPDPGTACPTTKPIECEQESIAINSVRFNPPTHNLMSYHRCHPQQITDDQARVIASSLKQPWRSQLGD
jgi:Pregnancy-associated plasma protein-A